MATTFHIEQKGLFKKTFTYEAVVGVADPDFLFAPVHDHYIIDTQSHPGVSNHCVVYRIKHLGRGFQVVFDGKKMDVIVNYLSTQEDIDNAFHFMSALMKRFNIKRITMNDQHEITSLKALEKAYQAYLQTNIKRFSMIDYKREVMTITGVYNPIYMDVTSWQHMSGKERLADFTTSLHSLQQVPGMYVMPEIDATTWSVTLTTQTPLILPKHPFIPIGSDLERLPHDAVVQFYDFEANQMIGRIDYLKFIEYIEIIPVGLHDYDVYYYAIDGMSQEYLNRMFHRMGVKTQ